MSSPSSPPTKTVSFASSHSTSTFSSADPTPAAAAAAAATPSSATTSTSLTGSEASTSRIGLERPQPKRRRSSIKQGLQMPYKPPQEYYTHRDPLLRRLRLRNGFGTMVNLEQEFTADTKVVLFFFGAIWRGSSQEPFQLVANFQRRFPHQCKVVFVSIDETKAAYDLNTKDKNWLSMEWNDGSNPDEPNATNPTIPPLEPFLLAGDSDLEEETSQSSPKNLYLRPFSRVYLTSDKWQVLGVPNLLVYHLESRTVLSHHARFELLREGKMLGTWEKWSRGEKITFGFYDAIVALRWTLVLLLLSSVYLVAVRQGWCDNVVANWSSSIGSNFASRGGTAAQIEL
ncbi:uncharacterized protein JCM15063_000377 [Sporobolomyces koalae]|uniref:uncharacterized protein n=1 Tax=Sporobolomyces koalae TaxID=500713 RepID=UPI003174330D